MGLYYPVIVSEDSTVEGGPKDAYTVEILGIAKDGSDIVTTCYDVESISRNVTEAIFLEIAEWGVGNREFPYPPDIQSKGAVYIKINVPLES